MCIHDNCLKAGLGRLYGLQLDNFYLRQLFGNTITRVFKGKEQEKEKQRKRKRKGNEKGKEVLRFAPIQ